MGRWVGKTFSFNKEEYAVKKDLLGRWIGYLLIVAAGVGFYWGIRSRVPTIPEMSLEEVSRLAKSTEDPDVRTAAVERWNELALRQAQLASTLDGTTEAFTLSPSNSQARVVAEIRMAEACNSTPDCSKVFEMIWESSDAGFSSPSKKAAQVALLKSQSFYEAAAQGAKTYLQAKELFVDSPYGIWAEHYDDAEKQTETSSEAENRALDRLLETPVLL
jgi:hypothetical protein